MRNGHLLKRCNSQLLRWFFCLPIILSESGIATELTVADAWVRLAPPTARVNAAYMTLTNTTDQPILITQVSADCCAMSMLHQTRQENEIASMVHLDQLEIPPASRVHLKPGGLHIMLMRPRQPLVEGDQVKLALTLSDGRIQQVIAPVMSSNE
jgi:copper(I)-binding protein